MIFCKTVKKIKRGMIFSAGTLILAACATTPVEDTLNSRLTQPVSPTAQASIDAGDIAIAGQYASHSIRDLPQVTDAPKPLLVQFTGVTSIINGPVDTEPYTTLLRDRLVVGSHEKLRYVERELPPLILAKPKKIKSKKELPPPVEINSDPDYQVLAELRGNYTDDLYKIQIQFVDFHTGEVLFNGLYHIRKEMPNPAAAQTTVTTQTFQIPPTSSSETGVPAPSPTPPSASTQPPPQ
jgi:PBP1b-binding outer membrane lipoprotein LpoB